MKKILKKSLVLICVVAMLMPLISGCGKKAPPKPPTKKSGEQIPGTPQK